MSRLRTRNLRAKRRALAANMRASLNPTLRSAAHQRHLDRYGADWHRWRQRNLQEAWQRKRHYSVVVAFVASMQRFADALQWTAESLGRLKEHAMLLRAAADARAAQ